MLFSAPEVLAHRDNYGLAVDVWAFGCCLVCLLSDSTLPYPRAVLEPSSAFIAAVVGGSLQPCLPVESSMHGFVRDCCRHSAALRPHADDIAKQLRVALARSEQDEEQRKVR